MREIKFRGRREGTKCWIYGNGLFHWNGSDWISTKDRSIPIVEGTGGEYTGLKDKNGIEIFEGDVVETGGGRGFVFWKESSAGFGIKWLGGKGDLLADICEVAGNIHDSPELLEKEK
jgi:hypothetical protein